MVNFHDAFFLFALDFHHLDIFSHVCILNLSIVMGAGRHLTAGKKTTTKIGITILAQELKNKNNVRHRVSIPLSSSVNNITFQLQ